MELPSLRYFKGGLRQPSQTRPENSCSTAQQAPWEGKSREFGEHVEKEAKGWLESYGQVEAWKMHRVGAVGWREGGVSRQRDWQVPGSRQGSWKSH